MCLKKAFTWSQVDLRAFQINRPVCANALLARAILESAAEPAGFFSASLISEPVKSVFRRMSTGQHTVNHDEPQELHPGGRNYRGRPPRVRFVGEIPPSHQRNDCHQKWPTHVPRHKSGHIGARTRHLLLDSARVQANREQSVEIHQW